MNAAILLSGGVGVRVGTPTPKQYARTNGRMMVTYALAPLLQSPLIDCVQVVAQEEWRKPILTDAAQADLNTDKIRGFSPSGVTRQCSILNAMQDLMSRISVIETDTILIHDAARPFLTESLISACYAALPEHDGVMPALPMNDMVYLVENGLRVESALDRNRVYAGQAPELFLFTPYYQANMALTPDELCQVIGATQPAIMAGMDIAVIPGDEDNFKITTERDMLRFMKRAKGEI